MKTSRVLIFKFPAVGSFGVFTLWGLGFRVLGYRRDIEVLSVFHCLLSKGSQEPWLMF